MIQAPQSELLTQLGNLVGASGALHGAIMQLYTNNLVPGPNSQLSDFIPATFVGYAPSAALVWGTPYNDVSGAAAVQGGAVQFTCTASTTQELIYWYYVTDSAGTKLLFAESFTRPATITQPGDAVVVVPIYAQGQPPVVGAPQSP